jgi:hypothetical protein
MSTISIYSHEAKEAHWLFTEQEPPDLHRCELGLTLINLKTRFIRHEKDATPKEKVTRYTQAQGRIQGHEHDGRTKAS